ncbi:hypothetical protein [Azospirillum tabaci]|uniref:hypothetical protein n=1 Tax=Azospirillum tabaci TaxID=2752310 RepID=UPI0016609022|nr:hypothetical protein [Azospirillum tabaci]
MAPLGRCMLPGVSEHHPHRALAEFKAYVGNACFVMTPPVARMVEHPESSTLHSS